MISYELVIPGEVINTNASIIKSDTLVWKVNEMRLLFDDYTLTAEYRVINSWAIIIVALLLIVAIWGVIVLIRKK